MPLIALKDLLDCLEVEQTGPDRWSAHNLDLPGAYRVFGGQLVAQAIAIATADAAGKVVKSIHVLFPREGDLALPIEFRATRLQDGRTFSNRHLVAAQGERVGVIVNYDHFTIAPDLADAYTVMVQGLTRDLYTEVKRYGTVGFLKSRLV